MTLLYLLDRIATFTEGDLFALLFLILCGAGILIILIMGIIEYINGGTYE